MHWEWIRGTLKSFAIGLVVVVLYVLSMGPVFRFAGGWDMPHERIEQLDFVYKPVGWAMKRSKPFEQIMFAYLTFWIGEFSLRGGQFGHHSLPQRVASWLPQSGRHRSA